MTKTHIPDAFLNQFKKIPVIASNPIFNPVYSLQDVKIPIELAPTARGERQYRKIANIQAQIFVKSFSKKIKLEAFDIRDVITEVDLNKKITWKNYHVCSHNDEYITENKIECEFKVTDNDYKVLIGIFKRTLEKCLSKYFTGFSIDCLEVMPNRYLFYFVMDQYYVQSDEKNIDVLEWCNSNTETDKK